MQQKTATGVLSVLFVVLACSLWAGAAAAAEPYPKGPVQLVIPFSAGGSTDIFWRSISDTLARNLGGPVSLVNKPGGGGMVGTSFVANAKPDGYTIVSANSDPLSIAPLFSQKAPYDSEKDFTYIAKLVVFPFTIAVRADSPFKTLEELVAYARANPGKLKAAVPGVGTTPHLIVDMFNQAANIVITPIPFGGAGETVPNLMGGHVDLAVVSIAPIKSQFVAGKARILATFAPTRPADFPQIPTIAEKGYKSANISTGIGLAGPKGLPPAVVKKWQDAVEQTLKDPKIVAIIDKLEGIIIDFKLGEAYKKEIMTDLAAFKPLVEKVHVKK